ncbi:MAG: hypothetical protein U1E89_02240 [Burkholderiaceae bacterium]
MPARTTLPFPGRTVSRPWPAADHGERRGPADDGRMQAALQAMQASRFADAFEQLADLADEGHPQAARMALLFAQRGTRLFGGRYAATAQQQRSWKRAAA